ncbi:NADH-quinone oxidoreductase subunit NuoG [Colwellia sp. 1_MG-2023]|uniref:NADH-quinone oxidoreductase subunit NuoG n=1 Tax=Colwellia sp. 1_MG-2023 TaxID=3062649 RepID=UPI0026E30ABD|nr:NADH-quinone oxidoreductase subunit NuoG [Colwellia sp. 1_MG-2023]MDO6444252.1 NADH-quinone oxidoreductase subunit NuoG [Colwellia sp. 1_MG-2023]
MSDDNNTPNTVTVYIDDQPYQVSTDDNLLAGVLSQKLNLPYFCWHPSMGSVGACRQCAVTQYQDENDQRGRLVMACTTPVTDGMRISLKDSQSETFREQVISAMMTNHPHDCPVCAEGGECHLQDMTVMTGHSTREYKGDKRTFVNQNLGEFVGHEMNRCITCYRCVRYYKDYAGGTDFGVYGTSNKVCFGRQEEGQLESEFSGNLIEVCPTGVFTNKLFSAHYTRKWDLQSAPSICSFCSVGCNTSVGERYGSVRRVMNRYNYDINGYFLCDKGRFGIGFVNGLTRIRKTKGISPQFPNKLSRLDVSKALVHFKGKHFIGVGSARASFEANYYLQQLVGKKQFSLGYSHNEMVFAEQHQQFLKHHKAPSLAEIEQSDFVLIIDEDITQIAPRIALSVRQALRNASIEQAEKLGVPSWQDSAVRTIGGNTLSPLYLLQSKATKLDDVAEAVILQKTQDTIELLHLFTTLLQNNHELSKLSDDNVSLLNKLLAAKKPLIVGGWSHQSSALFSATIEFIAVLSKAKHTLRACLLPPEANSIGQLALMDENSLSIEQVLYKVMDTEDEIDGLILLENDFAVLNDAQLNCLKETDKTIICLDHSDNQITALADIIFPAAPITESDGHLVNYQGQIQAFYQVHPSVLPVQESWRWLSLIAKAIYPKHALAQEVDSLAELHQLFFQQDANWPLNTAANANDAKAIKAIAREPHRASGRTAKMANISVHEAKVSQSTDNYRFSMEGGDLNHATEMPFTWSPGWNSNQSIHQFQRKVAGQLTHQANAQFIDFTDIKRVIEPRTPLSEHQQCFYPQIPWHRSGLQSSLNPEFALLHQVNKVFMSSTEIAKRQLMENHWVSLELTAACTGEKRQYIAQLLLDEKLTGDLIYGDIDQLPDRIYSEVSVSIASAQQVESYQNRCQQLRQKANQDKALILEKLKVQDAYIPIRLVSGGLDNA